jgi:hypothetical protein
MLIFAYGGTAVGIIMLFIIYTRIKAGKHQYDVRDFMFIITGTDKQNPDQIRGAGYEVDLLNPAEVQLLVDRGYGELHAYNTIINNLIPYKIFDETNGGAETLVLASAPLERGQPYVDAVDARQGVIRLSAGIIREVTTKGFGAIVTPYNYNDGDFVPHLTELKKIFGGTLPSNLLNTSIAVRPAVDAIKHQTIISDRIESANQGTKTVMRSFGHVASKSRKLEVLLRGRPDLGKKPAEITFYQERGVILWYAFFIMLGMVFGLLITWSPLGLLGGFVGFFIPLFFHRVLGWIGGETEI